MVILPKMQTEKKDETNVNFAKVDGSEQNGFFINKGKKNKCH